MAAVIAIAVAVPESETGTQAVAAVASGVSHTRSDPPTPDGAVLRSCPDLPTAGVTTNACAPIERLPDGTRVIMRCWQDGTAPTAQDPSYSSPRWFYVSLADREPHRAGWVHSSQIPEEEQVTTPECSDELLAQYQSTWDDPGPVGLSITGTCTTAGGTLIGISSGFTPGGAYDVAAAYPDGSPYPGVTGGVVGSDGSISWVWPCHGDPAGTYTTSVVDLATGRTTGDVSFTIHAPEPKPAAAPEPEPALPSTSSPPPTTRPRPPATASPARTTAPPAPSTRPTTGPPTSTPAPQPKPVIANFVVYAHGGGRAGAAFDLSWQEGRDPMTCRFFVDGALAYGPVQCGVRPSKQFQLPAGSHTFEVSAHDAFGVYADAPAPITRDIY